MCWGSDVRCQCTAVSNPDGGKGKDERVRSCLGSAQREGDLIILGKDAPESKIRLALIVGSETLQVAIAKAPSHSKEWGV